MITTYREFWDFYVQEHSKPATRGLHFVGTSLGLLLLPVGILAVMNYYQKGYIDVKVVGIMAIAFVLGGWLGSKMALAISEEAVKKVFAVILFYTAFKMLGWDAVIIKWVKSVFS